VEYLEREFEANLLLCDNVNPCDGNLISLVADHLDNDCECQETGFFYSKALYRAYFGKAAAYGMMEFGLSYDAKSPRWIA
jgi:hypothetical protein